MHEVIFNEGATFKLQTIRIRTGSPQDTFYTFYSFFFHGYIQGVLKKGYTDSFVIKFSRLRAFLKSIYNSGFNKPNFRRRPNNNNFKVSSSFQLE